VNESMKKQVAVALLAVLAAWPLFSSAWTGATGVDLAHSPGWASCTRPWLAPQLLVWKKMSGAWRPLEGTELSPVARTAVVKSVWQVSMKQIATPPHELGGLLLWQTPGVSAIRIEVRQPGVGPDTADVTISTELFDYE